MKRSFLLLFLVVFCWFNFVCYADDLNGVWEGRLSIRPDMSLRIVFNIDGYGSDKVSVTMDSPDQGSYGIPVSVVYMDSDSINVKVDNLYLSYCGRLNGENIHGMFSQGMFKCAMNLCRGKSAVNRPQTPKAPYGYSVSEVSFPSKSDGAELYGTFTAPFNCDALTPVVVLLSGSGIHNRDEEIFEHKPFAVIADYLARNGVAALRYDDRGYDQSKGLKPNNTTFENALDAEGAVGYLKNRGFKNIGLIGHSEGGLVADIMASKNKDIRFVVEIGGPSVSGDKILVYQNELMLGDGNVPKEYIAMYIDAMKGIMDSQKDDDSKAFVESDYEIFSAKNSTNPVLAKLAKNLKDNFMNLPPWLRYFINYDPLADINNIDVPMLFIYGEKDTQVAPELNAGLLKDKYPNVAVEVFPGLNHLMQHCETGRIAEYGKIEETIADEVLAAILNFIKAVCR